MSQQSAHIITAFWTAFWYPRPYSSLGQATRAGSSEAMHILSLLLQGFLLRGGRLMPVSRVVWQRSNISVPRAFTPSVSPTSSGTDARSTRYSKRLHRADLRRAHPRNLRKALFPGVHVLYHSRLIQRTRHKIFARAHFDKGSALRDAPHEVEESALLQGVLLEDGRGIHAVAEPRVNAVVQDVQSVLGSAGGRKRSIKVRATIPHRRGWSQPCSPFCSVCWRHGAAHAGWRRGGRARKCCNRAKARNE